MKGRPKIERCTGCGARLTPLEGLQEAAWQAIRGRHLAASSSEHKQPAYDHPTAVRYPVAALEKMNDPLDRAAFLLGASEDALLHARRELFFIACELAHRTGRCGEDARCPGSGQYWGRGHFLDLLLVPCSWCLQDCEVLDDGRLPGHSLNLAELERRHQERAAQRKSSQRRSSSR